MITPAQTETIEVCAGLPSAARRARRIDRSQHWNAASADGRHGSGRRRACADARLAAVRPPEPLSMPADKTAALAALRNIGPAMLRDLHLLRIRSVAQLARCDADRLYLRLERLSGQRQDPCVWDTFAAAIHQAKTGEALPWWQFTPERKRRQREGSFPQRRR
jgi:hypothetical protein